MIILWILHTKYYEQKTNYENNYWIVTYWLKVHSCWLVLLLGQKLLRNNSTKNHYPLEGELEILGVRIVNLELINISRRIRNSIKLLSGMEIGRVMIYILLSIKLGNLFVASSVKVGIKLFSRRRICMLLALIVEGILSNLIGKNWRTLSLKYRGISFRR